MGEAGVLSIGEGLTGKDLGKPAYQAADESMRAIYGWVSGRGVASFAERNSTARGINQATGYVNKVLAGEKEPLEVGADGVNAAYEGVIKPLANYANPQWGSLVTGTREENYDIGRKQTEGALVAVDLAGTAMGTAKMTKRLADALTPDGRKKNPYAERAEEGHDKEPNSPHREDHDSPHRRDPVVEGLQKDRKMKTRAEGLFGEFDLQELIGLLLQKMERMQGLLPVRGLAMEGPDVIVRMDSGHGRGHGGGGSRRSGEGTGETSIPGQGYHNETYAPRPHKLQQISGMSS